MKSVSQAIEAAFTLVEVLIVVAILAVLVALVLPSVKNSLESANTAKCASNLRQLWVGHNSYIQDHNGEFIPYLDEAGYIWPATLQLDGYIEEFSPVFSCPSFSKETNLRTPKQVAATSGGSGARTWGVYVHYGYNLMHIGSSLRYPAGDRSPARLPQISHPSKTILLADSIHTKGAAAPLGSYIVYDRPGSQHVPDARHHGAVNAVFVDGHVETLKLKNSDNPFLPSPDGLGKLMDEGSLWKR